LGGDNKRRKALYISKILIFADKRADKIDCLTEKNRIWNMREMNSGEADV